MSWLQIDGGPRPSLVIQIGAGVTVLAALSRAVFVALGLAASTHTLVAWWLWDLALALTGAGLAMTAIRPWMTRFGLVPAGFHLAQATVLAVVLIGSGVVAPAYHVLSTPKYLSLFLFTFTESRNLRLPRRLPLAAISLVGAAKTLITGRVAMTPVTGTLADTLVLVLLGWALFVVAGTLRRHENAWLERQIKARTAELADFNNPVAVASRAGIRPASRR